MFFFGWNTLFYLFLGGTLFTAAAYGGMYTRGGRANLGDIREAATIGLVLGIVSQIILGIVGMITGSDSPLLQLGLVPGLLMAFGLGWYASQPKEAEDEVPLGGHLWSPEAEDKRGQKRRKRRRAK